MAPKRSIAAAEQRRGIQKKYAPTTLVPKKGARVGHGADSVREIPEEHEQSRRVVSREDT